MVSGTELLSPRPTMSAMHAEAAEAGPGPARTQFQRYQSVRVVCTASGGKAGSNNGEVRVHEVDREDQQGPDHAYGRQSPGAAPGSMTLDGGVSGDGDHHCRGEVEGEHRRSGDGAIDREVVQEVRWFHGSQVGTITVWLSRAPPANAAVVATAAVSMVRAARPEGAGPRGGVIH